MKYKTPYMPIGFNHLKGEWNNGFTIEHQETKSKFVWIPLTILPDIWERLTKAVVKEAITVTDEYYIRQMLTNYGGIYFSAYPISMSEQLRPVAVSSDKYWNLICFSQAKSEAVEMGKMFDNCITRLYYDWEYDAIADTIRMLKNVEKLTNEDFEDFGLYGIYDWWTWTLKRHSAWSKIVKRGDPKDSDEEVFANSDYIAYKEITYRVILISN